MSDPLSPPNSRGGDASRGNPARGPLLIGCRVYAKMTETSEYCMFTF